MSSGQGGIERVDFLADPHRADAVADFLCQTVWPQDPGEWDDVVGFVFSPDFSFYYKANENDDILVAGGMSVYGVTAHLDLLGTHPEYRRQGLGTEMVKTLEQAARNAGALTMTVTATGEPAALFFDGRGYQSNSALADALFSKPADKFALIKQLNQEE